MQLYAEEEADVIELARARFPLLPPQFFRNIMSLIPSQHPRHLNPPRAQAPNGAAPRRAGGGGGDCSRRGVQYGVAFSGDLLLVTQTLNPHSWITPPSSQLLKPVPLLQPLNQ